MRIEAALLDSAAGLGRDPASAQLLFQRPEHRFELDISGDVPRFVVPPPADWKAGFPAFVKLGAKSWRDSGTLRIIPEQLPFLPAALRMLGQLTPLQQRYLDLVRPLRQRLDLLVYRYIDFSNISEARWRCEGGEARLSSWCLRGTSAEHARGQVEAMLGMIARAAPSLPPRVTIDLAIEPGGRISVLDVNPADPGQKDARANFS